jgi:nicotinamidase-related amidase
MPAVIDTASKLLRCARELNVPIIITEQYPRALGSTVEELAKDLPEGTTAMPKTVFSMMVPEVEEQLMQLQNVKQVMLVGIEAHVCVTATTLDLIDKGYEVHLITDGISSRTPEDRAVGLHRMMQAGALVSSFEMAAFQLMGDAKHPNFKAISSLAKEDRPQQLPKL